MLKFGIIGAGMIAPSGVEGAAKSGIAEVVAVADIHPGRLSAFAAKHGIKKTYPKAEDLIHDKGIDAVYIAVPNAYHAPYAVAALESGKHVILDKPFATSYAEASRVVEAARKSGKVFTVGMNQRFVEGAQKIRTLAERGYFGEIYRMRAFWRRRRGAPRLGTWFGSRKLSGGGCFLDIGVHMLDLALYTAGDFDAESVSGAVYTKFGNRGLGEGSWGASDPEGMPFDVDDCALALIRMKSGASVQVEISWAAHQKDGDNHNVEIFGTEADAQLYPGEVYRFDRDLGTNVEAGDLRLPLKYPHANRFVNFFRAILGEEELCVTHEQALKVQRIIDAVYESSATRHEIRL
ncbi:MAG: Gfo/Idh/MocA family oxidoreductase [Spirochaetes bacterium]|nr:Gfo/Idh/MocA family oxidoreductase [Spirochaetota bacterium]